MRYLWIVGLIALTMAGCATTDVIRTDRTKYAEDRAACDAALKAAPTDIGPAAAAVGGTTVLGAASGTVAGAILGAIGGGISAGEGALVGGAVGLIEGIAGVVIAHHTERHEALMQCMQTKGYLVAPWCEAHPDSWRCR